MKMDILPKTMYRFNAILRKIQSQFKNQIKMMNIPHSNLIIQLILILMFLLTLMKKKKEMEMKVLIMNTNMNMKLLLLMQTIDL